MRVALFALPFVLAVVNANAMEERDISSDVTNGASDAGSVGGAIYTKVTDIGGEAVTLVSEAGHGVYTLASDGFGTVTSIAGHAFNIATDAGHAFHDGASSEAHGEETPTESPNSGASLRPWTISVPVVSGLAALAGGVAAGAWIVL
ncbi:uncharacterized protein FOMMEDRAFT_27966 [Fomitiporia mediterranea MF3/22]|uniref:uncharacterized protein n=1 Tax=Fomitiporia mediterranea (strain MF3/22) TaxID=694068 RepID=UPI00044097BD|nr:uncharacterized protein FOMMEDRAFT_27966 [Fomitiporia mediterranea MF3/22]EJD04206.1 hypothetical protein FOMMEDRAFT_27966 [Fomitiporia mediterranea MF3/22]